MKQQETTSNQFKNLHKLVPLIESFEAESAEETLKRENIEQIEKCQELMCKVQDSLAEKVK